MTAANKMRRAGYAPPSSAVVGRRGLHTRERIIQCAAEVFLQNGFHATSIDMIATATGASRATIYQYFADKEEIFGELARDSARAAIQHAESLGPLGPTAEGLANLERWMHGWADIYDAHAAVFAEYPGIGTVMGLAVVDAQSVPEKFEQRITDRLRSAPIRGLDLADATAALMRIPHMVNLYRYRGMYGLPSRATVSTSLAIAMQLMLFPHAGNSPAFGTIAPSPTAKTPATTAGQTISPIRQDVLAAGSRLFAERGYYAVRMEEIAAAADVSRATLYRHFSTKDLILTELTRAAVRSIEHHAAALKDLAVEAFDVEAFSRWMLDYVRFHRVYRGVIRAWFDGTVAETLPDSAATDGIAAMHNAVSALLSTADLPVGMDRATAGAVFMATLGRMTEPTAAGDSDEHAAGVIVALLCRSLLGQPGAST
ncbi:TetR/AcrR family transcriptional regulator [Mycobacterium avium]|jgi:AcrR family transcriptional regulator|uniref:TetR/AcrR family transcriptional regulator n=2 Tax=Mycobacterium avium TaxID=1764 RepID=UPI00049F5625|nr:TetR/AcrR family transcriptional regulator [Mycobacterium avium]KDP06932.1 TetR family transcriptional regulator [Mycobacterium avium subsp. hominissuis 101]MBZ4508309.1 TetR/AcrR family transcriptional regulator [Mycobacterium avium subsp. hominissuis]MBZ4517134.1 TetR/AcrR family transcriptional regulator [Mycobacterium avium subsp. hominissuis]MBZ4528083.1 TetR/AcrR family transcriptional regulator [Mycobacterium avium subsp. hominissuis]MBZ4547294.1 TetR/AcrR family transcriptional regu